MARSLLGLALVAIGTAACGGSSRPPGADARSSPTPPSTAGGPLVAPKTTPAGDAAFFSDLSRVDPSLSSYVDSQGNGGLRALLTDGSAFCAFLSRGGGIDDAMSSVAQGARSVEAQTHLPMSVQTFNAIDAVALITLCPAELTHIPSSAQKNVRSLEQQLG